MKNIKFAVALTALAMAFGQQALASDGTLTFQGKVTDVTCTVSANGGSTGDATIALPTVSSSAFGSTPGTTAGSTPFTIALSSCSGTLGTGKNVAVYFEPGTSVNTNGRLSNTVTTGGATNVDIALYRASDDGIPLSLGQRPSGVYSTISTTTPSTTMNFLAKYFSTGTTVGAGPVESNVTYSIVYP